MVRKNKTKRKSIVLFAIILAITLLFGVLEIVPFSFGIYDYNPPLQNIKLGLDLKGGVYAVFEAKDTDANGDPIPAADFNKALNATMVSIEKRLVNKGYTESTVIQEGPKSIRVEIPDVEDAESVFAIIGKPAKLEFCSPDATDAANVKGEVLVGGENVASATAGVDTDGKPAVYLKFDKEGAKLFQAATEKNVGGKLYIWVDDVLISSPSVDSSIVGGNAIINGTFTAESAQNLAMQIQSGALPLELHTTLTRTLSPTLGENAITTSLIAAGVGLLLILLFMFLVYGLFGVASNLSLLIYSVLLVLLLSTLPWVQLTLPGIAGLILSIGMAVDGNIIIFERIKEEYKSGKSIIASCDAGYKKSVSAIVDGNITTLLGSVALWIFGSATLKGFAITLFVGIIVSMFCSLVITRFFIKKLLPLNSTKPKPYKLKREEATK
jgi:preprotein translocase subunit SecD